VYPLSIGLIIETKALWDDLQRALAELPVRVVLEQNGIADWPSFLEKLNRMRPDVLLVDIAGVKDMLEEAVQRIRSVAAPPAVFALHSQLDSDLILRTLRSGAGEYLFPPFKDSLRAALERVSAERNRQQQGAKPGGRAVGFLSAKGGCGATTVACHTASVLAGRTGQKTLLADFDLDAGMIAFLMKSKSQYTVFDALKNVHRLDANYWSALISNGIPHLEIMAAPAPPAAAQSITPEQIRYVVRFGRTQYDWMVFDLGRSLSQFSFQVVDEMDETFIVTTLEITALHQAKQLIQRLLDSGYGSHRLRLLLNRAPKRSEITLDELRGMLGLPVYAAIANDYASLQESYAEGKLAPPGSLLARQFNDLVAKIAGLDSSRQKKKFSLFSI
jgi:pilus assembly protein CpaE